MDALSEQVGGGHYKFMGIQPMEFSLKNHWDAAAHTTLKYVSRFHDKDGRQDLEKALHCLELRALLAEPKPLVDDLVGFLFPVEETRATLLDTGPFRARRWPAIPMEDYIRANGYRSYQEAALLRLEDYVMSGCDLSYQRARDAIIFLMSEEYPE